MQVALQVPITENNFVMPYTEVDENYAEYIEDTATLLAKIAQFPYVLYRFYKDNQPYIRVFDGETWSASELDDANAIKLSHAMHVSPVSQAFSEFKEFLNDKLDYQIRAASVVKFCCDAQGREILIILFSDQKHHTTKFSWHILEHYVAQRQKAVKWLHDATDLQAKLTHLENVNQGRAKYFSVIAHDLRAPFHGILGCADILANERSTLDDASAQRLADYIHDTTQATYGLLENLLNWSMAEGGRFHLRQVRFNIHDMVQSIFELLGAFAYRKKVKLQCDIQADLYAYADVRMVTSIIQNLASNALKFSAANMQKKVKISAILVDRVVEIRVEDQGIGMTEHQIQNVFKEHTVPSTQGTSGEKGTGLGLMLCKRFLEMNDGSIDIHSSKQGTCFVVKLPVAELVS